MPSFRLLAPALFALALCGAPPLASAQSFSDGQRGDIETIARKVTVLHEGSVLAEGPMDKVQNDPRVIEVYLGR